MSFCLNRFMRRGFGKNKIRRVNVRIIHRVKNSFYLFLYFEKVTLCYNDTNRLFIKENNDEYTRNERAQGENS